LFFVFVEKSLLSFKQSLRPTAFQALDHDFFRRTDHSACTVTWSSADIAEAAAAVPNLDAYTDGDYFVQTSDDQNTENILPRNNPLATNFYQSLCSPDDGGYHVLTADSYTNSNVPQSPIDVLSWWSDSP